jgi:hypothetical protein
MKLTPAQAYTAQVKADRRAAAIERCGEVVAADNNRVNAMFAITNERKVTTKKVTKATKKVRWSGPEFDLLIELYLKHVDLANKRDNREYIVEGFVQRYPERTESAVVLGVMQIKGLDAYYPAKGMKDTSQELIDKLYVADPVRFPGGANSEEKVLNALDLLLAELR